MIGELRVVAFMQAKPGQEAAVRAAILDCVEQSRLEQSCISYNAPIDKSDLALFVVIEHWASAAARNRHLQAPHLKRLVASIDGEHRLSKHEFHVLEPLLQ